MTQATLALANLATKGGANDEASRLAENAIKATPNSAIAYIAGARASLAAGNVLRATELLQQALKLDPSSLTGLAMLVKLTVNKERAKTQLCG